MRIIAGKWRKRQITAPTGKNTRPILDRAKTVLFDILGNRMAEPGRLPPVAVLDLFAGSGALGLEALSRGARYCLFVECNRASAALLRRNLDALEVINEGEVVEEDSTTVMFRPPPPSEDGEKRYQLVFVDPPYRMLAAPTPDPGIQKLLRRLADEPVIDSSALIVVRHELQSAGVPDLSPLVERENRNVGHMTFRLMGRPCGAK